MPTYVSAEKLEEMREEIVHRQKTVRREIAERISAAKELGDLSENFEYHDAKDAQGMNETKIQQLQHMVRDVVIIEEQRGGDTINLGCKFTVKFGDTEKDFELVGGNEADPMAGKISNDSPLGNAFLGHKVGDTVEVDVPNGVVKYEITRIH